MKLPWRRVALGCLATSVGCLCAVMAVGQATPTGQKPPAKAPAVPATKQPLAEDALKNVQVLKGIPLDEFMGTMGFFSAALSLNCIDCHVPEAAMDWNRFADDTPLKETARKMVLMVRAINKNNFAGQEMVTCYTCHRSNANPKIKPSLEELYGEVAPVDPDDVEAEGKAASSVPQANQILDKYIQAIGGAQQLATLTSFHANAKYEGFDTADSKIPAEIFAKAPDQRSTVAHIPAGGGIKDSTSTYDGRNGWVFARDTTVPLMTLTGGLLDGARADALLSFPGRIKEALTNLHANYQETTIDDRPVKIVAGTVGKSLVKLYFDKQSGLLVRQVRDASTVVGPNPTQIDYSDYRDVSGVKFPFHMVVSWTDGRTIWDLTDVQLNAPMDAAKFAKPTP